MKRILILLRQMKEFQNYIFKYVLELNFAQRSPKTRIIKDTFDLKGLKETLSFNITNN